jgi:MFS family permease
MSATLSQEDNYELSAPDSTILIENQNLPQTLPNNDGPSSQVPIPYSIFTVPQKRWITFVVAFIAWFSTLSSFIYFPALSLIALDLHTSIEGVNFTVTTYLIASAVIPSIVAPVADLKGRRPIYMITFSIYLIANIGLALQKSLVGLIFLRVVQSVGISGAFAITYGVIADIASPAERGSYVGVVALGFAKFFNTWMSS